MENDRLWPKLKRANVHELLRNAADVLRARPLVQGTIKHRASGAIDMTGAIALASGVRYDSLTDNYCEMIIPNNKVAGFLAAIDFVESSIDTDLSSWNDTPDRTKEQAIDLFEDLANEIESTI